MNVLDAIALEVSEQVDRKKEHLARGTCTHDDYLTLCGEIKGLLFAREYALDLKQRMENSDE